MKMALKLGLARLPVPYWVWRRLSIFRLGEMDHPRYVIDVFERHFSRSGLSGTSGHTVLELGPGDSVGSAVAAAAFGAAKTYLIDVGHFADHDVTLYRRIAAHLGAGGHDAPDLSDAQSLDDVLAACGAVYLTGGLRSLATIADEEIDFIWSHAVLEHVPCDELTITIAEMARVLRPDGVMSHRVDFQDHLAESLHNLRFSERTWESWLFRKSGFYTNRIRIGSLLEMMRSVGLAPKVVERDLWEAIPVSRDDLNERFAVASDTDLLTRGADVVARRRDLRRDGVGDESVRDSLPIVEG
jgi:SAM-dependent methyltransferase